MDYHSQLTQQRKQKDHFLGNHPQSPLSYQEQNDFSDLDYYPIDESYRFEVPLQPYEDVKIIEMDTSDGQTRQYDRIGYLEFKIDDQPTNIHIYQSKRNPEHYFIPFRDATSGNETYGAGRYLDIEEHGGVFKLDFNLAYNPFCAYSDAYSCPLPPMENWLDVPIKAGEKDYK